MCFLLFFRSWPQNDIICINHFMPIKIAGLGIHSNQAGTEGVSGTLLTGNSHTISLMKETGFWWKAKQQRDLCSKISTAPFLPWEKHRVIGNSTTHFDHDILVGGKDMKIPRIWSLPISLPTCGKKRVKWRGETVGFNKDRMNICIFRTESFSGNLFECL